jgi:hypothetical protein
MAAAMRERTPLDVRDRDMAWGRSGLGCPRDAKDRHSEIIESQRGEMKARGSGRILALWPLERSALARKFQRNMIFLE